MKARLIKECRAINPEFSTEDRAKAKSEGREYEVPKIITRPVGHIQDHPDSWKNCVHGFMNSEPVAVPEDEECKARVRKELEKRPKRIKALASILKNGNPSTKDGRDFYKALREAYASELHELDPDSFPEVGEQDVYVSEEDEDD